LPDLPKDPHARVADPAREELFERAIEGELSLRKRNPLVWWLTLFTPFVLTPIVTAGLYLIQGPAYVNKLLATASATMFLLGRFVILGGRAESMPDTKFPFSAWELSCLVVYMDLMVALLVVFHIGFLFRLPWLGRRLAVAAMEGRAILARQPWMRRLAFAATVAFVMFPLASTGSVGGGILARLCGMSRIAALVAIMLGSMLGCATMYLGAGLINRYLEKDSPVTVASGIALVLASILLLSWLYRRALRAGEPTS